MAGPLTVTFETPTRDEEDNLDYKATLTYQDKDGKEQTVELEGHEPLIVINMVNDAMRNSQIDLSRGAPPPAKKKDEAEEKHPVAAAAKQKAGQHQEQHAHAG